MDENNAQIARLEELLQETLEVAEENNKMLRSLQRTARWGFWGKLILWVVVLALPFLFLGPLLHAVVPAIPASTDAKSLLGVPSSTELQELISAYKHASTTP